MSRAAEIRRRGDGRHRPEKVFLLAGLLAVNVWVWSMVCTAAIQRKDSRIFDRELQRRRDKPSPLGAVWHATRPPAILQDSLIGRLAIPRLGLKAMVREGDGDDTLLGALGHIPGTALPGESGNVGVAGHRDTLFRGLGEIRPKDTIVFETLQGTYDYQVEATEIVKPEDVSVLRGSGSKLTLVTCYPFFYVGAAPERFIVKARLVPMRAGKL